MNASGTSAQPPRWSRLALCGLGALASILVSLGASLLMRPARVDAPAPEVWVSDRDGDMVFGLDRDLYVRVRVPVDAPLRVAATADGGAWVLHDRSAGQRDDRALLRLDVNGVPRASIACASAIDMDRLGSRGVLVAERSGVTLVDGFERTSRLPLHGMGTVRCVAVGDLFALVGTAEGVVELGFDPLHVRRRVLLPGPIGEVVSIAGGGWWALQQSSPQVLLALDENLAVISHVTLSRGVGRCSLAPGSARSAWLLVGGKRRLQCFRRSGVESLRATLALPGSAGAAAWRGGALACAGGALLLFDRRGFAGPGQGGFEWLSDVSPVPLESPVRTASSADYAVHTQR